MRPLLPALERPPADGAAPRADVLDGIQSLDDVAGVELVLVHPPPPLS
jgi:hypothetical protein